MGKERNHVVINAYLRKYNIDRCELCGSHRSIQVHHIVPVSLGGTDDEENLVAICEKCHTILTPTGLLTKAGLANVRRKNKASERFVNLWQDIRFECGLDEKDEDGNIVEIEDPDYIRLSFMDVLDMLLKFQNEFLNDKEIFP